MRNEPVTAVSHFFYQSIVLKQEHFFQPIHTHTGKIPEKSYNRDVTHIPSESDFFQSHNHYTGSTTNDKKATANTRTICKELPKLPILNKHHQLRVGSNSRSNVIHTYTPCHKRHIINNRRYGANHSGDEICVAIGSLLQPLSDLLKHPDFRKRCYRHKDTEEKQNR